jgi:hypothetical protein
VPSTIAESVQNAMNIFLTGVRDEFGAEELHFTEIYSGNGPWKSISAGRRAELFDIMASLMSQFSFPIVHQTAIDHTLRDHPDFLRSF